MTMVKSELINRIASRQENLPVKDIELSVNQILECLSESLSKDERIEIRGFGSFSLHYRAPRKAHNPKTGDRVFTTAKYTPHFKPGKDMRDRVNASRETIPHLKTDHEEETDSDE